MSLHTLHPGNYNVHSKPVYFVDELEYAVYFRGSTFELDCHVSCEQECIGFNKIYHNGSPDVPRSHHELTDNKRKLTLKINNANLEDSGFYQCFRVVWPFKARVSEIAGRKIHVEIIGGLCGSTCACVVCLYGSMLATACVYYIIFL